MPERPRLVADTNVLVSRLLSRNSVAAQAVRHAMARFQLIVSSETLKELTDVIKRPKFDSYLTTLDRLEFLRRLHRVAMHIENVDPVTACRDSKDNKFLALAVTGRASLILSGDQDLVTLHPFQGVEILTPRQYLDGKLWKHELIQPDF